MRASLRRVAAAASGAALAALLLSACSGGSSGNYETAADVVARLGAVPIPYATPGPPQPVAASSKHPQLLAMGDPVRVSLPGGATALINTSGPTYPPLTGPARPDAVVPGTITLTATSATGPIQLALADLRCRDDQGNLVVLTPVGPGSVTASPDTRRR